MEKTELDKYQIPVFSPVKALHFLKSYSCKNISDNT